jgi:hypothetical protein
MKPFHLGLVSALAMCFGLILQTATAQTQTPATTPVSDPQAVALATQAYAAMTGGASIQDVTLAGMERRIAGSLDETEPVTLNGMGIDSGRIDHPSSGRSEVRTSASGEPTGMWIGSDRVSHAMAGQNCWTDASWFFPAFSSAFSFSQDVHLSYVGLETLNGASVQHIRASKRVYDKSGNSVELIAQWSQIDVFLDSQSLLPVDVRFNIYPDNDTNVRIPVEIIFSDYRVVNGIHVPFHIQKYLQNVLNLDLTITSATFNSGLTSANFQIQ